LVAKSSVTLPVLVVSVSVLARTVFPKLAAPPTLIAPAILTAPPIVVVPPTVKLPTSMELPDTHTSSSNSALPAT
jgi:hypothetical protein